MSRVYKPCRVQDAFAWVDGRVAHGGRQRMALADAAGHLLAQHQAAEADIPAGPRSARDGYALRAADSLGASDYSPLPLQLVVASATVQRGQAARVCDGDRVPDGADAVLALDQADVTGGMLEVAASVATGDGIALVGEECGAGERLLPAGRRLRPQDVARLALAGVTEVAVRSPPAVCVAVAGRFGHDADGPMLSALIARDGGSLSALHVVGDAAGLTEVLLGSDADLVLVAGASGYADRDYAVPTLQACGQVQLDGVAMHPGGGIVLGEVGSRAVILLPGTPLACMCAYDLVAARLVRRLAGRQGALPYRRRRVALARKLVSRIGRMELARVRVSEDRVEPVATAEGRVLATAVHADGFVLIPENSEGYAAQSMVDVYLYDAYD